LTRQRKLAGGRDHRGIAAEMGFLAASRDAQLSPHRHCERSEAIQNLSAEGTLDCFAALAMTGGWSWARSNDEPH